MKNNNLQLYFDNYNICNLIKKIDRGYTLYFDNFQKKFVVVNSANNNEICMKFDNISPNILKILNYTRVCNSKKIFQEIEKNNTYLSEKMMSDIHQNISDKMQEMSYFCSRSNSISRADKIHFLEK